MKQKKNLLNNFEPLLTFRGKKIVIYFYPKDSTPGCTLEAKDFSRLKDDFLECNALILGVSKDSEESHNKFISKQDLCIELISDQEGLWTSFFGVWKKKKLYGKEHFGIERSTFLIDEEGELIKEWRGVKVPGHAEEVLNFLKSVGIK